MVGSLAFSLIWFEFTVSSISLSVHWGHCKGDVSNSKKHSVRYVFAMQLILVRK